MPQKFEDSELFKVVEKMYAQAKAIDDLRGPGQPIFVSHAYKEAFEAAVKASKHKTSTRMAPKNTPHTNRLRHILGTTKDGVTILGKTAPRSTLDVAQTVVNGEVKKVTPVVANDSGAFYTFPDDLKEGEAITIDGRVFDHTYAGKSIAIADVTSRPLREWSKEDRAGVKKSFEAQFGVHRDTRTPKQWQKLIDVYGIKQVCVAEQMDEATVRKHAGETFSQRLKRQINQKASKN